MKISRFSRFEIAAAILAVGGVCTPWVASAYSEGQDKNMICHRGREIIVADPAIFAAHLTHGDCAGPCRDCEGRCCFIADGVSVTALMLPYECAAVTGRFQPNVDLPCFAGGD